MVANGADAVNDSVANATIWLMLSCFRQFYYNEKIIREGMSHYFVIDRPLICNNVYRDMGRLFKHSHGARS